MQAVKEKIQDMNAMRKAKAEAKAEEKAEKEMAKARVEVAHEVRLAREAEAAMDLHAAKAGHKAMKEMNKYANNPATANMTALPGVVNMAVGPPPPAKKLL